MDAELGCPFSGKTGQRIVLKGENAAMDLRQAPSGAEGFYKQMRLDRFVFRKSSPADIEPTFAVRAATRENPIPELQLAVWGITADSVRERYARGDYIGWVCEDQGRIVGFCTGDLAGGEVLVLALLPEYEGMGVGKRLLSLLVGAMRESGRSDLWLSASPDPKIRAHGFYRALGWKPTGAVMENGDEVLVLADAPP